MMIKRVSAMMFKSSADALRACIEMGLQAKNPSKFNGTVLAFRSARGVSRKNADAFSQCAVWRWR